MRTMNTTQNTIMIEGQVDNSVLVIVTRNVNGDKTYIPLTDSEARRLIDLLQSQLGKGSVIGGLIP